jgi:Phosphodiester glycosidase
MLCRQCIVLAVVAIAARLSAAAMVTTNPFVGVKLHTITQTTPRLNVVNVVEIDMTADGISVLNTPGNGAAPGETNVETTSAYVNRVQAQVGINTTFFNLGGTPTDNIGLLTSNGELISSNDASKPAVLNVSQANVATVSNAGPAGTYTASGPAAIWNAVAGSDRIIRDGVNVSPADSNVAGAFLNLNPRTAAGVSQDKTKLFLLTVDGRQAGYSQGMYLREVADVFLSFGVWNALNLDGGGSTTMAIDYYYDGLGAQVQNRPSGGTQRAVGANLAIFAKATTPPPPPPPPNLKLFDTFASNEGHFTSAANASGTSRVNTGLTTITFEATGGVFNDGGNQKLAIVSDPVDSAPGWIFRNLSGGGSPANNDQFQATGYIGFFLKTTTPGIQASLLVDEEGTSRTERAAYIDVIADGEWHLYEWSLSDPDAWENFSTGNGTLNGAYFTIDALYLRSSNEGSPVIYFDHLVQNTTGSINAIIPEPATLALLPLLAAFRRRQH